MSLSTHAHFMFVDELCQLPAALVFKVGVVGSGPGHHANSTSPLAYLCIGRNRYAVGSEALDPVHVVNHAAANTVLVDKDVGIRNALSGGKILRLLFGNIGSLFGAYLDAIEVQSIPE